MLIGSLPQLWLQKNLVFSKGNLLWQDYSLKRPLESSVVFGTAQRGHATGHHHHSHHHPIEAGDDDNDDDAATRWTQETCTESCGSLVFPRGTHDTFPIFCRHKTTASHCPSQQISSFQPTTGRTGIKQISSDSTVFRFIAVVLYLPARSASEAGHASGKPPVKYWRRQRCGSGQRESENRATLYCVCCLAHRETRFKVQMRAAVMLCWHGMQRKLRLSWLQALGHRNEAIVLSQT